MAKVSYKILCRVLLGFGNRLSKGIMTRKVYWPYFIKAAKVYRKTMQKPIFGRISHPLVRTAHPARRQQLTCAMPPLRSLRRQS